MDLTDSRLIQAIGWQMPWLVDPSAWASSVPSFERRLATLLPRWLGESRWRHVLIVGPRRVGKTVVMQQAVRALIGSGVPLVRIGWLRLDHPELNRHALGDLVAMLRSWASDAGHPVSDDAPLYLFLDEVTRAADWDLWLKTFHDDGWPVRIVATSSATSLLRDFRKESGAGRWREIDLPPWLLHEQIAMMRAPMAISQSSHPAEAIAAAADLQPNLPPLLLDMHLNLYGFPEYPGLLGLAQTKPNPLDIQQHVQRWQNRIRDEIVSNAIYKDLLLQVNIREPEKLERLLMLLAGQVGGLVSSQSLAQTLATSQPTVDRYLAHLESTHLVFRVPCYAGSEEGRARRGRKLYFADASVRNATLLNGWLPMQDPDEQGVLRENAVAAHLHAVARRRGVRLYYWRGGRQHEVDFVFDHPQAPFAIEVSSSARHHRKGLAAIQEAHPRFVGRCWITWPGAPFRAPAAADRRVGTIDLATLLCALGGDADSALDQH